MKRKIGGVERKRETNTPDFGIKYKKHSSTNRMCRIYNEKSPRNGYNRFLDSHVIGPRVLSGRFI